MEEGEPENIEFTCGTMSQRIPTKSRLRGWRLKHCSCWLLLLFFLQWSIKGTASEQVILVLQHGGPDRTHTHPHQLFGLPVVSNTCRAADYGILSKGHCTNPQLTPRSHIAVLQETNSWGGGGADVVFFKLWLDLVTCNRATVSATGHSRSAHSSRIVGKILCLMLHEGGNQLDSSLCLGVKNTISRNSLRWFEDDGPFDSSDSHSTVMCKQL